MRRFSVARLSLVFKLQQLLVLLWAPLTDGSAGYKPPHTHTHTPPCLVCDLNGTRQISKQQLLRCDLLTNARRRRVVVVVVVCFNGF